MNCFKTDSAIIVHDPVAFADAVGHALPRFTYGIEGPCSYQSRRVVNAVLSKRNIPPDALAAFTTDSNDSQYSARMGALIGAVAQQDAYFLKHHRYMAQNEWRFIWFVDGEPEEVIEVLAPDARQFCEPWSSSTRFIAFNQFGPLEPEPS